MNNFDFDSKTASLTPSPQQKSVTIALVAGEVSGDLLGGPLIKALREYFPYARFVGIGGPEMIEQGLDSWYPLDSLSVMGIAAVLKELPRLLELRATLVKRIVKEQPIVFIGIDAPDFNLGLAKRLRSARIKTVHYVSPSVWAWRQRRVISIAQSIDLMLTLFPFEREFYLRHGVAAEFVGHPAADELPLVSVQQKYRDLVQSRIDQQQKTFDLQQHKLLAVLPGSRRGEVDYLLPVFLRTIFWVLTQRPETMFVIACANQARREQIEMIIQQTPKAQSLPIVLLEGGSRSIMGASDAVLLASGTATLEAMLLKKPMVVAYKWHCLTHFIISRMVKIQRFALPNILANEPLVPEYIQQSAKTKNIGPAVLDALNGQNKVALVAAFTSIHKTLAGGASQRAARAIAGMLSEKVS